MFISNFAISRPVITLVVMLALVVFGAMALLSLNTDEFPDVEPPVISVVVPYPGAGPQTVERELTTPLEEAFSAMTEVDQIDSTSTDGFAVIVITFLFSKDLQQASQDVRDKLSEVRQELPPEMEEPVLTRFDPQNLPIVSLTLTSERLDAPALTRLADPGIVAELRSIPGVADVTLVGGQERQLTVELDPRALQAHGVGVAGVVQALQAQNLAAPVGRVEGPLTERTLRLQGRLEGPRDFEALRVPSPSGRPLYLHELARVADSAEEPRSQALFDGRPAVGIDVKKSKGFSTTAVSEAVRARVAELRERLPPDVRLEVVRDAGPRVSRSVRDVEASLLEGAALTVLVVFLFLRSWRSTIITGLALPVSVLASFIAVRAFGFTLDTMSLLGLSLAIGILIDDAIVVRENIVRHMQLGKDHVTAAREGTSEIGLAVAATTFSIVVVFVPIAFMGGVAQQWFAPFALTIASSVLVSLLVSFSLDPMLSALWPDPEAEGAARSWLTARLAWFGRGFDALVPRYKRVIGWALRHRLATFAIVLAAFAGALALPATGVVGSAFFPVQDRSEFNLLLEMPPGASLPYTRLKTLEAIRLCRETEGVAYTYATIGDAYGGVDTATIYVRLHPKEQRAAHQTEIALELRRRIDRLVGVEASLTQGFGAQKQVQLRLTGPDLQQLEELAARLESEVEQVPGAVDVGLSSRGRKPELEIRPDRALAAQLGLTVADVARALRPAFAGLDVGDWVDPDGETRDVWVRLAPESRTRPEDLRGLPLVVPSSEGSRVVPLEQVARVERSLGPRQISHHDRRRLVIIGANSDGRPLSEVTAGIEARLAKVPLVPGYRIEQGGEVESQREVFGRILSALTIALLLMYLILVVQFGSFLDPVPVLISLPLSLVGVMLALLATGSTLNLMSMIGVILLMGIVAKNAILLIDFAKWAEARGKNREEAIIEAGAVRLRPIVMTSMAIVAGMLPVAIGAGEGGDFRAPLGRAVIGGVITATLLTLLVIPTLYDVLSRLRDRLLGRLFHGRRVLGGPGVEPRGDGGHVRAR